MLISTRTPVDDVRALAGAIALGSCAGLVIGAGYLASSGSKPAAPPAPTVSGSLQAANVAVGLKEHPHLPAVAVVAVAAAPPVQPLLAGVALRDRFRAAAQALHAVAQPFRFQQVADAQTDLHCLTEAVYFEARGEGAEGQQAVAQVVLNRVRHPAFPKTICAVVHQHTGSGCQFSFACSGRQAALTSVAWRRAETIASSEMHGTVMTAVGDATHFQAARASPFTGLLKVAQIGAHIFYRFGGHAGAPAMFHQVPGASAPAKIEVAQLGVAPAVKAAQPIPVDGRIKVTLYPSPPVAAAVKPEPAKLLAATSPEPKSAAPAPVRLNLALSPPPLATAAKPIGAPAADAALLSLALAQS